MLYNIPRGVGKCGNSAVQLVSWPSIPEKVCFVGHARAGNVCSATGNLCSILVAFCLGHYLEGTSEEGAYTISSPGWNSDQPSACVA